MNSITTLGNVYERVDDLSKHCFDTLTPVEDISFDCLEIVKIADEPHPVKPIAQQSFACRLGIPIQYLRRCPPEVQAYNLNHWIKEEKNEKLFVRFDGEEVRALFTPKYRPVDNFEVLERMDSLGYVSSTPVQCHLDAEFMSLSILDGKNSFKINGDKITPGISISNSEVGLASLSIAAFFLRLICTNGLVSKTEIAASYKHVSTKILDKFPEALEQVSFELANQRGQFQISVESKVDDPQATINRFNSQFLLGSTEKEAVEWAMPFEVGNTMFNIVNTYTKAAQYEPLSAESRFRLQKTGGQILSMLQH
jgi:hypothetical protein